MAKSFNSIKVLKDKFGEIFWKANIKEKERKIRKLDNQSKTQSNAYSI